jgi:hypothetical protein
MRTGQDFGCISIQCAVVHVQTEIDNASECNLQNSQYFPNISHVIDIHILRRRPNLRIRKKERHCDQRSNNHRILPPQPRSTHPSSKYRTPDTTEVD